MDFVVVVAPVVANLAWGGESGFGCREVWLEC